MVGSAYLSAVVVGVLYRTVVWSAPLHAVAPVSRERPVAGHGVLRFVSDGGSIPAEPAVGAAGQGAATDAEAPSEPTGDIIDPCAELTEEAALLACYAAVPDGDATDAPVAASAAVSHTEEASAGYDSNPQRMQGAGAAGAWIGEALARATLSVGGERRRAMLTAGLRTRYTSLARASGEDMVVAAAELQGSLAWSRWGGRGSLSYDEAFSPYREVVAARSFRNLHGEAWLTRPLEAGMVGLGLGLRAYAYKPVASQAYRAVSGQFRWNHMVWRDDAERTLELAARLSVEDRHFEGPRYEATCDPLRDSLSCIMATTERRRDLASTGAVDLTYQGEAWVLAGGYRLLWNASDSYGGSYLWHYGQVAVSRALGTRWYGSLTAIAQLQAYQDGLAVDTASNETVSIDVDKRSSLQARLSYELSAHWQLEARVAAWRALGASDGDAYQRAQYLIGVARQ